MGTKISILKLFAVASLGVLLVSGCVKHDDFFERVYETSPITDGRTVVLRTDVIEDIKPYYNDKLSSRVTLLKGEYKATKLSEDGVFYQGPPHHYEERFTSGVIFLATGGLFVPNDFSEPLRLWYELEDAKRFYSDGRPMSTAPPLMAVDSNGRILGSGPHRGPILRQHLNPENSSLLRVLFTQGIFGVRSKTCLQ